MYGSMSFAAKAPVEEGAMQMLGWRKRGDCYRYLVALWSLFPRFPHASLLKI